MASCRRRGRGCRGLVGGEVLFGKFGVVLSGQWESVSRNLPIATA
jgi:hypothetical protein